MPVRDIPKGILERRTRYRHDMAQACSRAQRKLADDVGL